MCHENTSKRIGKMRTSRLNASKSSGRRICPRLSRAGLNKGGRRRQQKTREKEDAGYDKKARIEKKSGASAEEKKSKQKVKGGGTRRVSLSVSIS